MLYSAEVRKRRKFNIFIILGFFILVYNPPILRINSMHLVGLFSWIYLCFNGTSKLKLSFSKEDVRSFRGFILIALYLLIFVCCLNSQSLASAAVPIYFILDIMPFGMALRSYASKYQLDTFWKVEMMLCAGVIQSITATLAFTIPSLQTFFVDRMVAYGYSEVYTTLSTYRMYGFSNSLTSGTPIMQTMMAIVAIYMAQSQGRKFYFLAGTLLFSAVINARISVVVALVGVVALILLGRYSIKKKIKYIFTILAAVIAFIYLFLPIVKDTSPLTYKWIISGVEEINLFSNATPSGGDYSFISYITDNERYTLPSGVSLLIGKGYAIMPSNNPSGIQSDVGYINDIWLGGILYVILTYSVFTKFMVKMIKSKIELISFVGLLFLITIPIVNIKGTAYSMNAFMNFLVVIYFSKDTILPVSLMSLSEKR